MERENLTKNRKGKEGYYEKKRKMKDEQEKRKVNDRKVKRKGKK